ncbi:MAG: cobalt ECF transporter T component CbiQ [Methanomicrobiales archaeon]|nr:cobalt ECF transporter T component CbiQ [Methanomicrobiales archaeon]
MIEEIYAIETLAMGTTWVHRLDARLKIILVFAIIIVMVSCPIRPEVWISGLIAMIPCAVLWLSAKFPLGTYARRLFLILPFGLFVIVFQVFYPNQLFESVTILYSLPLVFFSISIYAESLLFAQILLVKFLVCISYIILLSSTTTMQDLLIGGRRLGLPAEMTLVIGLMVRYLFVAAGMFQRVQNMFLVRFFSPLATHLPYRYRLSVLAYATGTLFLRSYEQGERVYMSMLCRGYGKDSYLHVSNKPFTKQEWMFVVCSLVFCIGVMVLQFIGTEIMYTMNFA